MKAIHVMVVGFILCCLFSEQVVTAQELAVPVTKVVPAPEGKSEEGRVIRIPIGALNITIDDGEQPFHLENLDRRFDGKSLTKFLAGYLAKSGGVAVVVTSVTKRQVEGEQEFNEFLERIAKQKNVLIVSMPPPTGDDPDTDLKNYAADLQDSKSNTGKRKQGSQ